MGFFSWNCKGCGESIKAPYDIPEGIEWQNNAIVIGQGPNINRGSYDGYGRINGIEVNHVVEDPEMWHEKCWIDAGSPLEYTGASEYAEDQGFFYGDGCGVECFEVVDEDDCDDSI